MMQPEFLQTVVFFLSLCPIFSFASFSLPSDPFVSFGPMSLVSPSSHSQGMLDLLIASETNRNHRRRSAKSSMPPGKFSYLPASNGQSFADLPGHMPKHSGAGQLDRGNYYVPISAAVHTKHSVEPKDVEIESEQFNPQTVIVDATVMPLTIYFRSSSSMVKVVQEHMESKPEVQHSQSEDPAHRLFHEVHKPIIQEIREIVVPIRKIFQEIEPVNEEVKTIISRPEGGQSREQVYERKGYEEPDRGQFDPLDDRFSGFMTNVNSLNSINDLPPIGDEQSISAEHRNLSPKTQSNDYSSGRASDEQNNYDRSSERNAGDQSSEVTSTTESTQSLATTTTTESPTTVGTVGKSRKRRKHQTTAENSSNARSHMVPGKTPDGNLTRSRRLSIKRLVNKIDRQKRKIRLGFFGIYGINLIPYIYDKFALNVKVRMSESTKS